MKANENSTRTNDFAVTKSLNDLVKGIIVLLYVGIGQDLAKDSDIDGLNRAYILLTNEIEKIYSRYPELQELKPDPIWKHFDVLKGSTEALADHINDTDDFGHNHNLRVEKLCIIYGAEEPNYTHEQQKLVKAANDLTVKYVEILKDTHSKNSSKKVEYGWEIFEYGLTYKPDGTILINHALKLKKVHAGSITEKLLEQSIKNPNKKFKPDLGKTSRNISTIISSAGFTPVLRDLFFPTVSGDTIVFRPYITKHQADIERIDRSELDLQLRENGALCRVVFEPN